MERRVRASQHYFVDFIQSLDDVQLRKVFYVIEMLKTQERLSEKFVKHLEDGIYELRAVSGSNIFRVLFIFDEGNIVLLLNGFSKKMRKTPRREIELAKRLRKECEYEKSKQHR